MFAISIENAKNIGTVALIALAVGGFVIAWAIKEVTQKLIGLAVIAALVFGVWTQRASVETCAKQVAENRLAVETTCSFFGRDVKVPARSLSDLGS